MARRFDEAIRPPGRCRFCHKYLGHCRCRVSADDQNNRGDDRDTGNGELANRGCFLNPALPGATTTADTPSSPVTEATSSSAGGESGLRHHATQQPLKWDAIESIKQGAPMDDLTRHRLCNMAQDEACRLEGSNPTHRAGFVRLPIQRPHDAEAK